MNKKPSLLVWLLVISTVIVACIGAYIKYGVLRPYGLDSDVGIIDAPFVLMADDTLRISLEYLSTEPEVTEPEETPETKDTEATVETEAPTEEATQEATEDTIAPTEETEEVTTEPTYKEIDESWFDDVLFIGDSRTQGLAMYGRLGKADYFCDVGLSVFSLDGTVCTGSFGRCTIRTLLWQKTYGKIYINLGMNEIMKEHSLLIAQYEKIVEMIHELQPDAKIILQAVMTLGRDKSSYQDYYSLESIQDLNDRIAELAESADYLYYIDVNEWIADEEGYLPDGWTQDGCHPYAAGYAEWGQWLLENAATLGIE